jgi:hypothetical protein
MSARAIVFRTRHKAAEERTSKARKPFATFIVRESVNGTTRYWSGVAFDEAVITTIRTTRVGDPISVAGEINVDLWAPRDGREPRLNWSIRVDGVLTAQPQRKPKAATRSRDAPSDRAIDDAFPRGWAPVMDDIRFDPEVR